MPFRNVRCNSLSDIEASALVSKVRSQYKKRLEEYGPEDDGTKKMKGFLLYAEKKQRELALSNAKRNNGKDN